MYVGQHSSVHDDVTKWKHFPCYWPFVRGIHRPPVTRSFDVSLICVWINGWVNNHVAAAVVAEEEEEEEEGEEEEEEMEAENDEDNDDDIDRILCSHSYI